MALIFRNVKGSALTYTEMDENLRLLYSASVYNATGSGVPVSSSYSSTASYYGGSVISSSYASTASYVINSISSSYVQIAQTASYVSTAQTASYVLTSSYSRTASYVQNAITASYIQTAQTASYVLQSVSSSYSSRSAYSLPRTTSIVSNATPTINTDTTDTVDITALATAITSMTTNLSGSPVNFQRLMFRIKDNGGAQSITWGAAFIAMGVDLPTTTVAGKILVVGFIYDSTTGRWGCIASNQEV